MPSLENRIPPPIMTLIVALAMGAAAHATPPLVVNGWLRFSLIAVFFGLGAVFGFPALRAFRRAKTTIDPVRIDRASTVVKTGVYRITRNPMYAAMTCLLLSWAAYLAAPWSLLGPVFFVLYITRFQIIPEERAMSAKFGSAYAVYKNDVRRWL